MPLASEFCDRRGCSSDEHRIDDAGDFQYFMGDGETLVLSHAAAAVYCIAVYCDDIRIEPPGAIDDGVGFRNSRYTAPTSTDGDLGGGYTTNFRFWHVGNFKLGVGVRAAGGEKRKSNGGYFFAGNN